ncbi:hypothetical protein BGZ94_009732 [Podila epigama]|nr:hypothetical protein BGZ94_009732 [Podila epigama]
MPPTSPSHYILIPKESYNDEDNDINSSDNSSPSSSTSALLPTSVTIHQGRPQSSSATVTPTRSYPRRARKLLWLLVGVSLIWFSHECYVLFTSPQYTGFTIPAIPGLSRIASSEPKKVEQGPLPADKEDVTLSTAGDQVVQIEPVDSPDATLDQEGDVTSPGSGSSGDSNSDNSSDNDSELFDVEDTSSDTNNGNIDNSNVSHESTIISHEATSDKINEMPKIIDMIIYNGEVEQLELRLNELIHVVDTFVIIESTTGSDGTPKPLHYRENEKDFAEFAPKILYIEVPPQEEPEASSNKDTEHPSQEEPEAASGKDTEQPPPQSKNENTWNAKTHARDRGVALALQSLQPRDGDWILFSELDEIPRPAILRVMKTPNPASAFEAPFVNQWEAKDTSGNDIDSNSDSGESSSSSIDSSTSTDNNVDDSTTINNIDDSNTVSKADDSSTVSKSDLFRLACRHYHYSFEYYSGWWYGPVAIRFRKERIDSYVSDPVQRDMLTAITANDWESAGSLLHKARTSDAATVIEDAGWHCSMCYSTISAVVERVKLFSNEGLEEAPTEQSILEHYNKGIDLLDRSQEPYTRIQNNLDIPDYVRRNKRRFAYLRERFGKENAGFVDVLPPKTPK